MKVKLLNKKSNDTISNNDIHTNGNSLNEMIRSTSQNIKKTVFIDKMDNVKKTFNKSISKTIREHQRYYID